MYNHSQILTKTAVCGASITEMEMARAGAVRRLTGSPKGNTWNPSAIPAENKNYGLTRI